MKILSLIGFIAAVAVVISGCVSVESAVDKNFHKTINKVFIEVNSNKDMNDYLHDFGLGLQSDFSMLGIQSELKEIGPLSLLGKSDIERYIDSSHADVVLVVGDGKTKESYSAGAYNGRTGMWTGGGSYTSGSEMAVALYEPHQDKPVWKATVSTNTGGFGMGSASSAATKIIEKLQEDRLIPFLSPKADTTKGDK
jgi:hypothetical protein